MNVLKLWVFSASCSCVNCPLISLLDQVFISHQMPFLPWIQTPFLALNLVLSVKILTLVGKCKYFILLVSQNHCNAISSLHKSELWWGDGTAVQTILYLYAAKRRGNPGTGEPGKSPFTTAQHERPLPYNVWWLFADVLVVCRDTGTPLILTCRAQKSILDACPVHMAHRELQLLLYMTCLWFCPCFCFKLCMVLL